MDERAFYTEKEETRKVQLVCPSCHKDFEFPVRWKVCRKKKELPRGASPEDRKKFDHATSYMVRLDDLVACYKCRKRSEEHTSELQSLAYLVCRLLLEKK